jgi:hypothetical protein
LIFVAARNSEAQTPAHNSPNIATADESLRTRVVERFGKLALSFETNKGQTNPAVKFLSHGRGYDLFLTASEAVLSLQKPPVPTPNELKPPTLGKSGAPDTNVREGSILRLKMIGANTNAAVEGLDELPGKVNYFIGNDPEKWQRDVPTFRKVYYKDVYPGIDIVYYGNQQELEYDFIVAPGANPKIIKFQVEGSERIRLNETGDLLLTLKHGEVRLNKPFIYQNAADGKRREVKGTYVVKGTEISFKLNGFDARKPLVIDPVLTYSTFLGSTGDEAAFDIAVDSQGSAYVTGRTNVSTFPTTAGAFKTTNQSGGVIVTKLNPTGTALVYSTYLGGTAFSSLGTSIAVDASGNAHVTGFTTSLDFPVVNGLKTSGNFFKTVNSASSWSNANTGLANADIRTIAVAPNAANVIYVGTVSGPFRSSDSGATWTKLPTTGMGFPFSTSMAVHPTNAAIVYTGVINGGLFRSVNNGTSWNPVPLPVQFAVVFSIVFDPVTPATMYIGTGNGVFKSTDSGNTWVPVNNFGLTFPPNVRALAIPSTAPSTIYAGTFGSGIFKTTNGGTNWSPINTGLTGNDAMFVNTLVIDPFNASIIYAGHGSSSVGGGAISKTTNAGSSWGPINNGVPNFQVTALVADRTTPPIIYAASAGGGVIKTTNGGTNWTAATNGLWSTNVFALAISPSNSAILYAGASGTSLNDAFVTKLNASGSGLLFSTYLGGSRSEEGQGIAVDGVGNIYVAGMTGSTNFPVLNAVQSAPLATENCNDAFVTKINPAVPSIVFSTYLGGSGCDMARSVAVDSAANVYVTGNTSSADFPVANAFQPNIGEAFNGDVFVTKLTSTGSMGYSTFLGGSGFDVGFDIAVDVSGSAHVTGFTGSPNFPIANAMQPVLAGSGQEIFITKLNSAGSGLIYSTFFGGTDNDTGRAIVLDSTGNAYVTGFTGSRDFPLTAGSLRTKSGMFKSVDGGAKWSNDSYGLPGELTSLAIDPVRTSTLYAGTIKGIYKTTNGGRTWSPSNNGLLNFRVLALIVDPLTPSTIYALTNEIGNNKHGVNKSVDGGNSWNMRRNGMGSVQLLSLAIDPVTPNTLYAGAFGGPTTSMFKTTDGADNWAPVGTAPPFNPVSIVVDPFNHTTVYAAENSSNGGVFKSTNAGVSWQLVGAGQTSPFVFSIAISPLTPNLLYAHSSGTLIKSVNGGTNWTQVRPAGGRVVFDPVSSSTVYLMSTDGLQKSMDNGQTWVPLNKGLNEPVAHALAIDPLRPSTLHVVSTALGGDDAFVIKINPTGSTLIYSTLLGGPLAEGDFGFGNSQGLGIAVDSAGNPYVSGLARSPNFPTTPNSFQPLNRGFNDAFITKLGVSFIISGRVLDGGGPPLSGAEVVLNDNGLLTAVHSESDGSYEFSRLRQGGTFTVSASKPHFTMAPPSQTFANLDNDQTLNFTATASASAFHTISGKVTDNGVALAGVTVKLSGSQAGLRTTDSNGNYLFEVIAAGNYTVTPTILGFTLGPISQSFTNLTAPQTANFTATRQNFVVTNTNNHGAGSLREAITNANTTVGADKIVFNIPGSGVRVINLLNALPEITDPVVIDAGTQPGYAGKPIVELNGSAIINSNGFVIRAGVTTVRGFAIGGFDSSTGIWIRDCDNNVIQGNYIGVNAAGTLARENNRGILLSNSSNNLIGGTTAASRNVVSGSRFDGIELNGTNNIVQGNFIGTDAGGTTAIPNGISGVAITSSQFINNVIGGTAAGAGNLISGNQRGITAQAPGTVIQGNLIGTDITGTKKVPNGTGILAQAANISIGGLTAGARNIISGNGGDGLTLSGAGSKLHGNYIGTDITGAFDLGNGGSGVVAGDSVVIGGTAAGARNVISGNAGFGNISLGSNNSGSAAIVQGNYIGTDVTGTKAIRSTTFAGITISSDNHQIGGTVAGAQNVISGHIVGIQVGGFISSATRGNVIQGNLIGLNAQGTAPLPNSQQGIVFSTAENNTVGGTQAGAANKIAFNGSSGVLVFAGTGNSIRGNSIFSNNRLGIDLGTDGINPNDLTDSDTGPNNLQNFPVLTSVTSGASSTTIQGSLKSTPNTTFQIDFYSSAALDPSGNGEGALAFGVTSVSTNANGDATINASIAAALPAGRVITATATDPNGNTSEFSASTPNAAGTGSAQFAFNSFFVIEDVVHATVTVLRTGGSAGTLSVNYSTSNGTATAGQDYTSTSGTLTFLNGETSKTIQVPITNDTTTEPDETFTLALNAANIESLGAPIAMQITIQDRTTVPQLLSFDATVTEGNTGTQTALFEVRLSAATGRTVSVNYATANFNAHGFASCDTAGADYVSASGTITFQPGTFSINIPVTVCGDTSAESNEAFAVNLTSPNNATIANGQGIGSILNDDVLQLLLEESSPNINQAAAVDALLYLRDPFPVVSIPEMYAAGPDRNTRVMLFVKNLQLNPGETSAAVVVRLIASNNQVFEVPADDFRAIPNSEFMQVVFRLPDNLPPGTAVVFVRAHARISNSGTFRIAP